VREHFLESMQAVTNELVEMSEIAGRMIGEATTALLNTDRQTAESVIAMDTDMDRLFVSVSERTFEIIALQAPVAADLRLCIAGMQMAQTLERMGDLAQHVAVTARRSHPEPAVPADIAPVFAEMGGIAVRMVDLVGTVVRTQELSALLHIEAEDDRMDDLHRTMFTTMLSPDWGHGVDTAVNVTLLSRFYERFADHAVSVARRLVFLVTGQRDTADLL
jgi:phosphate transport system protein